MQRFPPATQTLEVEFKPNRQNACALWQYRPVSEELASKIVDPSNSAGKVFFEEVKASKDITAIQVGVTMEPTEGDPINVHVGTDPDIEIPGSSSGDVLHSDPPSENGAAPAPSVHSSDGSMKPGAQPDAHSSDGSMKPGDESGSEVLDEEPEPEEESAPPSAPAEEE